MKKIGVSIYSPRELDQITKFFQLDLVQAPYNILDTRLLTSGWLYRLKDAGVEIHTRSIFLQGLLLLPRNQIPHKFERWNWLWDKWHEWLLMKKQSAMQTCLAFVSNLSEADRVIVGVDGVAQLLEIVNIFNSTGTSEFPNNLNCTDEKLLNPSNWSEL